MLRHIVLDAMGVIYAAHDDVAELLYPFIVGKGGIGDYALVSEIYIDASLGKMTAPEFWKRVGISPGVEDEYLRRHVLNDGLFDFLNCMQLRGMDVWCLSNDVSEWSKKMRRNFRIEGYFRGFIISGDVGLRKPDPAIYELLAERLKCKPGEIMFVDDNERNLDAAAALGIEAVLFNSSGKDYTSKHKTVHGFKELALLVNG